jgi:two-component system chemotaxis response regulator CheB
MTGTRPEAVVIGASAGALEALTAILPALPEHFPLPLMIVVHMPPDKESILAELFRARCRIQVREAEDKEPVTGGTAYFAPPDYHLLVEADRCLSLSNEEPVLHSRPSIGKVIVQSSKGAFAAAMPEAAKAMCPGAQVLTPQQIAAYLQKVSSVP